MNDERYLRDWLQDTTDSTTDPKAAADTIVARVSDSPQRHRWLPWPSVRRPKTNDAPTNRRNRFMFSPAQTLAAIALAITAGGTMLLATQDSAPAELLPAQAVEPVTAVPLRFDIEFDLDVPGRREAMANGSSRLRGDSAVFQVMEATDPRFEGTATRTETVDAHDGVELASGAWRIENEGGAWQETATFGLSFKSSVYHVGLTSDHLFVGEDGYDGYIAILRSTTRPDAEVVSGIPVEAPDAADIRFEGHVLNTTDLPEVPEPWSPAK